MLQISEGCPSRDIIGEPIEAEGEQDNIQRFLAAHPHRKAGATSVIKWSKRSRFHGGRKVGI